MELWLDGVEIDLITKIDQMGILKGVTTNPTLLASENPMQIIDELLSIQKGPVAIQVLGDTKVEMIEQALFLNKISSRILPKIPVLPEGIMAMRELQEKNLDFLATAVISFRQAFLAFQAGVPCVAAYLGRFSDEGKDPSQLLEFMVKMKKNYGFKTRIMAAGIRSLDHLYKGAEFGIESATLPKTVFQQLLTTPDSVSLALQKFQSDWQESKNFLFEREESPIREGLASA